MKKTILTFAILIFALSASAQDFVAINPDARTAAMGDATVAATADAYAVYNNAAAPLFEYQAVQVGYVYAPWMSSAVKGSDLMSLAGYVKLGQRHSISIGGRMFREPKLLVDGEYPFVPTDKKGNPINIKSANPNGKSIEAAYGFRICNRVALAMTARYLHYASGLGDKYSAMNFDLAAYSQLPLSFREGAVVNIGAQVSNAGFSITDNGFSQPLTAKVGASLLTPFGDTHLLLAEIDLGYRFAPVGMKSLIANVGVEYSLMQLLKFRAGYAHNIYDYATVGLGLRFMHVQVDASYWASGKNCPWRNTFRVGVGLEF